ncbi:hypothetical protein HET69_13430 [Streptomyces sp. CJ_13]|uniref:hypothetical protein n=1 Tax=Streptomyces sp. CJ_13 TaxID=2724943 RepID=UPI001BDBEA55|nr:hypothetical protein [Streptomyces sp. CJ_13]MBT1184997.1 hypothetical protein [Streptomyces sp. CJ_13]
MAGTNTFLMVADSKLVSYSNITALLQAGVSEHLKSLIISAAQELWEDKDTLGKFLNVVRRSQTFAPLADSMAQSEVRPAKPTFYGVKSTEFQS